MMQRLSVVIPNYNYGEFVRAAIESALAVDWPDVEVIVVDDGSTDDSVAVIESFGDRIQFLQQPNAGPRVACNNGYAHSTGDVVIFLDSDDQLVPSVAKKVAAVLRPGVSKVQFQMQRVDADGIAFDKPFPSFWGTPEPAEILRWMLATSAYPTAPGSGNAYTRDFLEKLFPIDDRCGDSTDSSVLAAAPILGDVLTIAEPLALYRIHGSNRSSLRADPARFPKQLVRAYQRQNFAESLVAGQDTGSGVLKPMFRGRHLLQLRVSERRLLGSSTLPGDGWLRMLGDCFLVPFAPGPEGVSHRILNSAWCLATLIAPRPLAERLINARFN